MNVVSLIELLLTILRKKVTDHFLFCFIDQYTHRIYKKKRIIVPYV